MFPIWTMRSSLLSFSSYALFTFVHFFPPNLLFLSFILDRGELYRELFHILVLSGSTEQTF